MANGLEEVIAALGELTDKAGAMSHLADSIEGNTEAVKELSKDLGGLPSAIAGIAGGVQDGGGVLGSVLKSGLGLAPLGLKIAGLFGGDREEPQAPTPFVQAGSLDLEVANTQNIQAGFQRVERGVTEAPRTVLWQPQVTVNVSAMDSRSFLDRSEDIARAVREAMLYMHPVNDLISEL